MVKVKTGCHQDLCKRRKFLNAAHDDQQICDCTTYRVNGIFNCRQILQNVQVITQVINITVMNQVLQYEEKRSCSVYGKGSQLFQCVRCI